MSERLKVSAIFKSEEAYLEFLNDIFNGILKDKTIDRKEEYKVTLEDGETVKLLACDVLINFILWYPLFCFKKPVSKEYVFDCRKINSESLASYFDKLISDLITHDNIKALNESLAFCIESLGNISYYFNPSIGNTISIYDMIQLSKKNKRFKEIINTKFDNDTSSYDIEATLKSRLGELNEILKTEPNNLRDFMNAKEGINPLQLSQFAINVGNRPTLSGKTIPQPVNSNFLKGLETPSQYYIEALSGRKSAIINNTNVKQSGYLNRKLSILSIGVQNRFDIEDCGTPNTVKIHITDENLLTKFNHRSIVLEDGSLKEIDASKDKELIGTVINLRSPITCACKDGICRTCYGKKLSYLNRDIHIGLLSVMELTSRLSQMLISAKHFLNTKSEEIKWPDGFQDSFVIENNAIFTDSTLSNFEIHIDNKQLFESNEENEIGEENEFKHFIREFTLVTKGNKETFKVSKDLYISPSFEAIITEKGVKEEDKIIIAGKHIPHDEPIFLIEINNTELAASLKSVFALLDSKERLGVQTYDEMVETINGFLIKGNIKIESIHSEIIIYSMIRRPTKLSRRPNFKKPNPPYTILRVSDAIMNSGSLIERISFEKLRNLLQSPEIFEDVWKGSLFDNLFSNDVAD